MIDVLLVIPIALSRDLRLVDDEALDNVGPGQRWIHTTRPDAAIDRFAYIILLWSKFNKKLSCRKETVRLLRDPI